MTPFLPVVPELPDTGWTVSVPAVGAAGSGACVLRDWTSLRWAVSMGMARARQQLP